MHAARTGLSVIPSARGVRTQTPIAIVSAMPKPMLMSHVSAASIRTVRSPLHPFAQDRQPHRNTCGDLLAEAAGNLGAGVPSLITPQRLRGVHRRRRQDLHNNSGSPGPERPRPMLDPRS